MAAETEQIADAIVIEPEETPPMVSAAEICKKCGSPIEAGDRFCPACGGPQDVPSEAPRKKTHHLRCETCSAEIATDHQQRSYVCPFCDSTYVVEYTPQQTGRRRPEFIIGFSVTREQALETFRRWLKENQWFRPKDLSSAAIEGKQRGVYLPFWSFSARVHSSWTASIGEDWYETESYTTMVNGKMETKTRRVRRTEWWPLSGQHHRYYAGYLISASRGLPQQDAQKIQPFDLRQLVRYRPYFLAGWLNEEYSMSNDAAWKICQDYFFQTE